MIEFNSPYASILMDFISFKRNLGYKYPNLYHWRDIDRFLLSNPGHSLGLSKEQVEKWSMLRPNETRRNQYERICRIRNFSTYLNMMDYPSFIPRTAKVPHSNFMPYCFTKREIGLLFDAADSLENKNHGSKAIASSVFRVLYGCALRVSELTFLKISDIHIQEAIPYIQIMDSKNREERLVPLSPSVKEVFKEYLPHRPDSLHPECFLTRLGMPLTTAEIYNWFREMLVKAGIPHQGKGKGPRVHDLRHSATIHALASMVNNGLDLYYCLPLLSRFLGHKNIESIDAYVRLTEEMYPDFLHRMEGINSFIFEEVVDENQ